MELQAEPPAEGEGCDEEQEDASDEGATVTGPSN